MTKALFALPFLALGLIAAKPAPAPVKPVPPINAPAEIAADPANRWILELSNGGRVVVQLRPDVAPHHVYRIQQLTAQGFYNGLKFHRVISGFMAQGGDPQGTGEGGSPLPDLKAEFNHLPHLRGVASMARGEDADSGNSQFFIVLAPTFKLDRKYSGFGRVIEGMTFVDTLAVGEPPADPTRIVRATIGGPLPQPPAGALTATVAPAAPAPVASVPAPAQAPDSTSVASVPATAPAPAASVPATVSAPDPAPAASVPAPDPAPAPEDAPPGQ